jgi:murein DD-endopeptidase MepM/ murein hydrolase activator NlpD
MFLGSFAFLGQLNGQQVFVGHDDPVQSAGPASKKVPASETSKALPPKAPIAKALPVSLKPAAPEKQKSQTGSVAVAHPPAASSASTAPSPARAAPSPAKAQPIVPIATNPTAKPTKAAAGLPDPRTMRLTRVEGPKPESQDQLPLSSTESPNRSLRPLETAFVKVADGFDFPVGKPDAQGYYKARGFRSHGHMGEDWDGIRGGDTDLGDPIYCIGDGIVVFARDCHMGWGNVVIVRHSYREGGLVKNVDSLYGHCDKILVHHGQVVSRGQQIATIGTAHGLYDAHLHLEIRKNIEIGMSRAKFAQDSTNYFDPTQFISAHRHLQGGGGSYRVAMNTFFQDARINWAAVRNYKHAHTGGGTRESAAALKKAVAKKN